jgi:hypothetical protein
MGRHYQWRGTMGKNQHWQKEIVVHCEGLFRKITELLQHKWTAAVQVTELNIRLEDPVSTKTVWHELHKPNLHGGLQLLNLWLLKEMLRCVNDGVMTIKPGHPTTGNACLIRSDESSFTLFPTAGRVYIWRAPKEAYNPECLFPRVKYGVGSVMVWATILWYSVRLIITPYGRITAREYVERLGNQVHPMIQTLFPNNDAVFQDDSAPINTAGTVQS